MTTQDRRGMFDERSRYAPASHHVVLTHPLTDKDLEQVSADGKRFKIVDEAFDAASPATPHQRLSHRLLKVIDAASRFRPCGTP